MSWGAGHGKLGLSPAGIDTRPQTVLDEHAGRVRKDAASFHISFHGLGGLLRHQQPKNASPTPKATSSYVSATPAALWRSTARAASTLAARSPKSNGSHAATMRGALPHAPAYEISGRWGPQTGAV